MNVLEIDAKLRHAVTEYDRKELEKYQKKPAMRYYNFNALDMYLSAVAQTVEDINTGVPLRKALVSHFCGRLLDRCLVAVGEPKSTDAEQRGSLSDFGY